MIDGILGIDVSKNTLDVSISSCTKVRTKSFANTASRHSQTKEHAMSQNLNSAVAVIGIDIGKNSFHVVGLDDRGAIVPRQKWSRGQIEARLTNLPPCLIGMEACVGAHHLSRKLKAFGHDARLMPAKYVRPYV